MAKKLEGILKSFKKTSDQLRQLISQNSREIDFTTQEIQHLAERKLALVSENEKASKVIDNINKLIEA